MVLEVDDDEEHLETIQTQDTSIETDHELTLDTPQLSLQALTGAPNFHTMRISALHNKKLIQILLDSGSTHNFLDLDIAKKNLVANLSPSNPYPLLVVVATNLLLLIFVKILNGLYNKQNSLLMSLFYL